MFRIRFHGRGGQGMKTASRILGTAFFKAGYQVRDAPRYGAERRRAPIFAYGRALPARDRNTPVLQGRDRAFQDPERLSVKPAHDFDAILDADQVMTLELL